MVGSDRAGSTLEIDSGHKNKKFGFYLKFLRRVLRILCVVDASIYACSELPATYLVINYSD